MSIPAKNSIPIPETGIDPNSNSQFLSILNSNKSQVLEFPVQGAAGPSAEIFLSKLCKNLSIYTEEPRAGSFFLNGLPGNTDCERCLRTRNKK